MVEGRPWNDLDMWRRRHPSHGDGNWTDKLRTAPHEAAERKHSSSSSSQYPINLWSIESRFIETINYQWFCFCGLIQEIWMNEWQNIQYLSWLLTYLCTTNSEWLIMSLESYSLDLKPTDSRGETRKKLGLISSSPVSFIFIIYIYILFTN